ncbi:MAG: hypothetical protein ACJAS4_002247 [Bacteriovoracaceae bacterium]|jgi:hypothetical protein
MNEIFDKLLIRILFTLFICLALFIYKYAHVIFYPSNKKQILKKIYPSENYIDTLHIFSRLIGISLIFSTLEFNEYIGISISTFHFFVWSVVGICFYLLSIYILENIIFYNFEYKDEVLKKKNPAYGVVSFANAICLAFIIKTIFKESDNSIIILIILWLFSLVLFGFSTRLFKFVSKLSFNSLMIQKNLGLSFAYTGFLFGNTVIIMAAFSHEHHDIGSYMVQVILKTLLGALILPIFKYGLTLIFKVSESVNQGLQEENIHLGHGIYIGAVYLTCSLLTSIIIAQIHFGTIYPFF